MLVRVTQAVALLSFTLLVSTNAAARGAVLLQNDDIRFGHALVNQEFDDFPAFSSYTVQHVQNYFDWIVTDIITYGTPFPVFPGDSVPVTVTAILANLVSTGPFTFTTLPTASDLPGNLGSFAASYTVLSSNVAEFHLSGLNVHLVGNQNRDFNTNPWGNWIGMTPDLPFGSYGQSFHYVNQFGSSLESAIRNPGGAVGFLAGTDWMYTVGIGGFSEANYPMTMILLGEELVPPPPPPSPVPEPLSLIAWGVGSSSLGVRYWKLQRRLMLTRST
jgi:hypothetical protein